MVSVTQKWQAFAGLNGFMAIAMGAAGAHAASSPYAASLIDKASHYQLVHALLLLWLCERDGKWLAISRWLIATGIVLFCGSLYLKGLDWLPAATALAPLGGSSFMAAWIGILCAAYFTRKETRHD